MVVGVVVVVVVVVGDKNAFASFFIFEGPTASFNAFL
jgi:hypothetical protein